MGNMKEPYPMEPGFYLMDCMEGMKHFPDDFFDLAIVDPPYGDGNSEIGGGYTVRGMVQPIQDGGTDSGRASTDTRAWNRFAGGTTFRKYITATRPRQEENNKKSIAWDVSPGKEYFQELFRVSRDQIIWGGNYFDLPPTRCFLVWRKLSISENFSMAMAEYAWTSFKGNAKVFEAAPQGTKTEQRFHPTAKPIKLYEWILGRYAKRGMKILDTHVGSASSLIACHRAGLEYWGFEIDPDYFQKATERLEAEKAQQNLFQAMPGSEQEQLTF